MMECFCGEQASNFCKPCQVAVCKEHKMIHLEEKETGHSFEKLGQKLAPKQLAKIRKNISSKIKVIEDCKNQILDESERLLEILTNSRMQALQIIEEKRQHYERLLLLCDKRLLDDQIKEMERITRTSLVVNMPTHQSSEIQKFYATDFLKELEKVKNIASIPLNDATLLLEEEYGLYLQAHTGWVISVAISSDNKYMISGGNDKTVRLWDLQHKTQNAVFQGHTGFVTAVAITSNNKYIVSGGTDNTVRI